jgi:3-hydroxybutyrate dehydrogenase
MTDTFLNQRRALVTGGTSGIGLAIAQALAKAGCIVSINGLGNSEQIAQAVSSIASSDKQPARFIDADLRDTVAIEQMMQTFDDDNALAILINCAGMQHAKPLSDMPVTAWDAILAVNLSAAFHTMRLALPMMAKQQYGRVINIASVHGLVASANKAPYVASKFGLLGLSKAAALEYAAIGTRQSGAVTVNCICPGWVETPLIDPQISARAIAIGGTRDEGIRDLLKEKQPSLRMSLPEEIADSALWLCRREAHNITGASIAIDGAWTAQ